MRAVVLIVGQLDRTGGDKRNLGQIEGERARIGHGERLVFQPGHPLVRLNRHDDRPVTGKPIRHVTGIRVVNIGRSARIARFDRTFDPALYITADVTDNLQLGRLSISP